MIVNGREYRAAEKSQLDRSTAEQVWERVSDGRPIGTIRILVTLGQGTAGVRFEFRGEVPPEDAEAFATAARQALEDLGGHGFKVTITNVAPNVSN